MEARTAFADYDEDGRWTLTTTSQGGWSLKEMLAAHVFKVPEEKFRIITPDVGGGFGMKLFLYAEHVLVCYAARKLGRPVRWTSERGEAFLSDTHGRDQISSRRAGAGWRGQIPRHAHPHRGRHGRLFLQLRAVHPDPRRLQSARQRL